jgi:23S rRNA pseudoU1915 N3-methylase RlmH
MSYAEREGLARRMLGELALLVHFAEARRGMDDSKWREERTRRLAKAVEALSGGRIAGDDAERLAGLIISYAESREERTKKRIENLAEKVGASKEEVWGIVDFILSDMYCLARDCARDAVVRKFVALALELIMLDKALRGEFDREEALLLFGEMYATALAGDGSVEPDRVVLTVGGELGGGVALLRLAALHLLNRLLSDELKFNARLRVGQSVYNIAAYGENTAGLMRLLAVSAPSAGGGYLSEKFEEFVEEAQVEVRLDKNSIRQTEKGRVAADLIISEAGVAVKYNVYLHDDAIELEFKSTDRSRVELAARLLRHAGATAEVKKEGGRDVWYVEITTDKLAAGRKELREALAEFVGAVVKNGGVDEKKKAAHWLEKLEKGRVLKEGWPKYQVRLTHSGALVVRFSSTDRNSIEREKQRLENMGLEEDKHFTVNMPEGGKGYVLILKEGLAHAAWLSVHSKDKDQRELAADFVKIILQRAEEAGKEVYEKASKIVEKGKARSSQTLKGFVKEVEVNGKTYVVKVIDGEAVEEDKGDRKLLRIRITAEVDGVRSDYVMTYGRYGKHNAALGRATARTGREADAERFAAVIKALTGKEPRIHRMKDGRTMIECYGGHLEGFEQYVELADAIVKWLEETRRR